jgi:hypothetical protein
MALCFAVFRNFISLTSSSYFYTLSIYLFILALSYYKMKFLVVDVLMDVIWVLSLSLSPS